MSYLPENYTNDGNRYLIGYSEKFQNCHLYDGDQFTISAEADGTFKLNYDAVLSGVVVPNIGTACKNFWDTVTLTYQESYGILIGTGEDQIAGTGERDVSIALDRSRETPYVIHIYVSARNGPAPPPDDGSATGTGKR